MMPRYIAALPLSFICFTGCALLQPVGDSAFRVRGKIVPVDGSQPNVCELQIVREQGERLAASRQVTATFLESFTLAPGFHRYYMLLRCEGYAGQHKTQSYELGGSRHHSPPLDLGLISIAK